VNPDEGPAEPGARFDNVLVPIDGSALAARAVRTARALARHFGANLHTVGVARTDKDRANLRAAASAALGGGPGKGRAYVVVADDPAAAIARRADEIGSCLVCLSTHGRGRVHGALVGSVARSVLQHSAAPMVVLGPDADNPGWERPPPGWPEPLSVPRIVACVDGSEASEQVLPLAAAWARGLGMALTILTVVEDAPPPASGSSEVRDGGAPNAASYIEGLVAQWRPHVGSVDGEVVPDPLGPARGVRAHVDRRPAGLVAVTTHARSGLSRVLLGATAADIVHASSVPCLVAPVR
jgi:nucleotide-binding universal stress UspA family protein